MKAAILCFINIIASKERMKIRSKNENFVRKKVNYLLRELKGKFSLNSY